MATPDIPHRFEHEFEVTASPEQVWQAIASAEGLSAWMMPTELEPRQGGAVVFHMGPEPEMTSQGRITAYEPSRRLVYEEDWAALAGQDGSATTPLVTEFLVEARSGGTCVVKVVTSAYGAGADWEHEFFGDMGRGWAPMLDNLRLYLTHFPGQRGTMLSVDAEVPGSPEAAIEAVSRALGVSAVGESVEVHGVRGRVERRLDHHLLIRLDPPVSGLLSVFAFGTESSSAIHLVGHLFADGAAGYVEQHQGDWQEWLTEVATGAGTAPNRRPG